MEYSNDDQSCCGCREIFRCIFRCSRTQDRPPSFTVPTNSEKYDPRLEQRTKPQGNASDSERHGQIQGSRSSSDINKAFSDYINQGKIKIRAMSNVGIDDMEIVYSTADKASDRGSGKKTDVNDMFGDYINRTKKNIRKTSSLGSRMISFAK